jgi:hypothetical protein
MGTKGRILGAVLCTLVGSAGAAHAAFVKGTGGADLLFGLDDDTQPGGQIAFADLTAAKPDFVVVSLDEVKKINPTVARIVR